MPRATVEDIKQELRYAKLRTQSAREAYEAALRYEERMSCTLEIMQNEEES